MDFTNRSSSEQAEQSDQSDQSDVVPVSRGSGSGINNSSISSVKRSDSADTNKKPNSSNDNDNKWMRVGIFTSIIAVVILIVALIVFVAANNNTNSPANTNSKEASYVQTNKLQAVFLNTGQVYFGNIKTLNTSYVVLSNIYYLQTASNGSSSSSTSSNSNVTLVKLGCELHKPLDQMVINRSQVTFWENLDPSGQVSQAVAKYQSQNPSHKCVDQSTSAGTSSGNAAQGATGNVKP